MASDGSEQLFPETAQMVPGQVGRVLGALKLPGKPLTVLGMTKPVLGSF